MRFIKLAIAATILLFAAGAASAADWTTDDAAADGTNKCSSLRLSGERKVCYLADIAEDSTAIIVSECDTVFITVYGTGASIMPQDCKDFACAAAADREDLLATALTGDSPNMGITIDPAPEILRIDWSAGGAAPTVKIKCGR